MFHGCARTSGNGIVKKYDELLPAEKSSDVSMRRRSCAEAVGLLRLSVREKSRALFFAGGAMLFLLLKIFSVFIGNNYEQKKQTFAGITDIII
ncbi:MAG: hypothetical protein CRN43_01060 [Candidatus Nephrothrix sp. EaCA]|nr:MAG: hypothetical protein CRN43_01060 [Candidatus Nephrothrix sp. EaCA]